MVHGAAPFTIPVWQCCIWWEDVYIIKDLFIFNSHVEICIWWKITAHFHHLVWGLLYLMTLMECEMVRFVTVIKRSLSFSHRTWSCVPNGSGGMWNGASYYCLISQGAAHFLLVCGLFIWWLRGDVKWCCYQKELLVSSWHEKIHALWNSLHPVYFHFAASIYWFNYCFVNFPVPIYWA